jgi:hypothetical protein
MSEEEIAGHRRKLVGLDRKIFGQTTPRVQDLTIEDLNKLAAVADGSAAAAGKLVQLDADDLRSLEDAFHEARLQAGELLARRLQPDQGVAPEEGEIFDNWSCCSCTPCCCCAAADVDPFE